MQLQTTRQTHHQNSNTPHMSRLLESANTVVQRNIDKLEMVQQDLGL